MKRLMTLIMVLMPLLTVVSMATTIHVPADQPTIQAGIDAAVDGDTVLVGPGHFSEDSLVIRHKHLSMVGATAPDTTALYSRILIDSSLVVFRNLFFEERTKRFEKGGAIYCIRSSVSLDSVVVRMRYAANGGAVYAEDCSLLSVWNSFLSGSSGSGDNCQSASGGGIYFSGDSAMICNSEILGSTVCEWPFNPTSTSGGALCVRARVFKMSGCTVNGHASSWSPKGAEASGGAALIGADSAYITACTIKGWARASTNTGFSKGGAVYCTSRFLEAKNNVISGYALSENTKDNPFFWGWVRHKVERCSLEAVRDLSIRICFRTAIATPHLWEMFSRLYSLQEAAPSGYRRKGK